MTQVWMIISKDVLIERRAMGRFFALLSFAVLTLLLFSFAVGPQSDLLRKHAPGYLWLGTLFASSILYAQPFQLETETNAIEQLMIAPVAPVAIFYGKALANAAQLFLLMLLMLPPLIALCDVTFAEGPVPFLCVLIAGALGLSAPGAMYAAMTALIPAQSLSRPLAFRTAAGGRRKKASM